MVHWRPWWWLLNVLLRSILITGAASRFDYPDEEASAKNGTVKVVEALMARNERLDTAPVGEPSSTEIQGDVVKNGAAPSPVTSLFMAFIVGVAYPHLADNPVHRAAPF